MEQYLIPKIDPKVFKQERIQKDRTYKVGENKMQKILEETPILPIISGARAWPEIPQGIEISYVNVPFPRKGFPDPDIINALNNVKKDTIALIRLFANKQTVPFLILFAFYPFPKKIKLLNFEIAIYLEKANYWMDFWYYKDEFYCVFAKEMLELGDKFLKKLGIKQSRRLAEIGANFMEHDDAYRVRWQDLFNEMDYISLLNNPRKELKRVYQIYKQREKSGLSNVEKFDSVFRLLNLALLHPRVKKAFREALKEVDFRKFKFDKGDIYYACVWENYDVQGEPLEMRQARAAGQHTEKAPMVKMNY